MKQLCIIILCLSLAPIAFAAPVRTPSPRKAELISEKQCAAEIAAYYAANPDAALAATNWPALWAEANNDSKKIKALGDRAAADDAVKKAKDKADKEKAKDK